MLMLRWPCTSLFMREIVANFSNEWVLTSADIDEAIAALSGRATP